mmetsp:Transcript_16789/g.53147  ORF Transcript_16789/g.53147 Transcript_16789/m.53147 type:complete len:363 (+) Transcript_16789:735-1823(+)
MSRRALQVQALRRQLDGGPLHRLLGPLRRLRLQPRLLCQGRLRRLGGRPRSPRLLEPLPCSRVRLSQPGLNLVEGDHLRGLVLQHVLHAAPEHLQPLEVWSVARDAVHPPRVAPLALRQGLAVEPVAPPPQGRLQGVERVLGGPGLGDVLHLPGPRVLLHRAEEPGEHIAHRHVTRPVVTQGHGPLVGAVAVLQGDGHVEVMQLLQLAAVLKLPLHYQLPRLPPRHPREQVPLPVPHAHRGGVLLQRAVLCGLDLMFQNLVEGRARVPLGRALLRGAARGKERGDRANARLAQHLLALLLAKGRKLLLQRRPLVGNRLVRGQDGLPPVRRYHNGLQELAGQRVDVHLGAELHLGLGPGIVLG